MRSFSHFVFLVIFVSFCDCYDLIVQTNYGRVGGVLKKSENYGKYFSFTRIPFAKPPVGNLRFANPQKPDPWSDVLDGSKSSPRCIQRNYLFYIDPPIEGSEDCLYLNVYVPQKSVHKKNARFPVMVSIPWGGFIAGGGDEGFFGPEYLMDHDVILVSMNYRLGVFGFLSTLDDAAPGNFGFKDQVLALQWVQENIEYFGGIKEKVTVMGQSAGAGSSSLHLVSPASKGLFSNAISQSGNPLAIWATPSNDAQKTALPIQAKLLNCTDLIGNNVELIQCFRKVSAKDIALSLDEFKSFYQFPYTPYPTVVENKTAKNPNPFLTKTPLEYLEAGEFQKVPWLTGTVKNEGLVVVSALLGPEEERNALNRSFAAIVPELLALSAITNDTQGLYKNISEQYLGGKDYIDSDDEWLQGFVNLWSDRYFMYSAYQTVSLQASKGHNSIYFYSFEYSGEDTFAAQWANGTGVLYKKSWSISHCDDLLYLFKIPDIFDHQLIYRADRELSNTMLRLWVNFATYGNPNPEENLVLEDVNWEPVEARSFQLTNNDIQLLNITGSYRTGAEFNITRGFNVERISFWEENGVIEGS